MRFELGQRVRFTDTVAKAGGEDVDVTYAPAGLPTAWDRPGGTSFEEGVVVGHRVLMDHRGGREWEPSDDLGISGHWISTSTPVKGSQRIAWLVAYHLRRRPVLVLDEHAHPAEERTHAA